LARLKSVVGSFWGEIKTRFTEKFDENNEEKNTTAKIFMSTIFWIIKLCVDL